MPLYGRAGIREFWLVDVKKRKLEVYLDPGESGYPNVLGLSRKATVAPLAFPDLTIMVGDVLRPV